MGSKRKIFTIDLTEFRKLLEFTNFPEDTNIIDIRINFERDIVEIKAESSQFGMITEYKELPKESIITLERAYSFKSLLRK